ncbi:unnamed protein product [Periconia digitata]|uniref:Uncharacterized protein n=1 Tax=Periconia digitata TaxID=1303443 RepID=A0A9W4UH07_9PLEO|nr:unnamed protein product [Periconia digitata]
MRGVSTHYQLTTQLQGCLESNPLGTFCSPSEGIPQTMSGPHSPAFFHMVLSLPLSHAYACERTFEIPKKPRRERVASQFIRIPQDQALALCSFGTARLSYRIVLLL